MSDATGINEAIMHNGFAVVPRVIGEDEVEELIRALENAAVLDARGVRRRRGAYALRNLLDAVPRVRALAGSSTLRNLVEPRFGDSRCFVVRALLFDKTPEANWKVAWHQDLAIAVRARREVAGFGAWTKKAGVPHAQPPMEILQRMLTVRLHLDAGGEANAPLRVVPGSHQHGRLSAADSARLRSESASVTCLVPRGGALLMRPLLLHASSPARTPGHRRVIHLEFAAEELPGDLEWYEREAGA